MTILACAFGRETRRSGVNKKIKTFGRRFFAPSKKTLWPRICPLPPIKRQGRNIGATMNLDRPGVVPKLTTLCKNPHIFNVTGDRVSRTERKGRIPRAGFSRGWQAQNSLEARLCVFWAAARSGPAGAAVGRGAFLPPKAGDYYLCGAKKTAEWVRAKRGAQKKGGH
jgi:hypothetical protein